MPITSDAASASGRGGGSVNAPASLVHLSSAGVSILLRLLPTALPVVLHWGRDLGDLTGLDADAVLTAFSPLDRRGAPVELPSIVPTSGRGWASRPGVLGARAGRSGSGPMTVSQAQLVSGTGLGPGLVQVGADTLVIAAEVPDHQLSIDLAVQLTAHGLVRCRAGLTNAGSDPYRLDGLDLFVPVDDRATHRIELKPAGRCSTPLGQGSLAVESWAAETRPALLILGEAETRFRHGLVWQVHVAFSGAVRHRTERGPSGATYLGGGELLRSGEVELGPGESYHSPWLVWTWAEGLDAASRRAHDQVRSQTRPVVGPVIFDAAGPAFAQHDRASLLSIAEYAAAVGAEAFLLDLGWCARSGLDPYADHSTGETGLGEAPRDLDGLLARIREFDLEPGFALAPELLEADAETARDHPDWLVAVERRGRVDQVLDLSVRPAMVHVWERLTKLLDRHPVGVVSWMLEETTVEPGDRPGGGRPSQHARTLAAYRLLDALRERYPQVVVVSGSLDLAMATRAAGADPATDASRRHADIAGLLQVLPPELVWQVVHDEPEEATSAAFRAVSGFFGQLGLGIDLSRQTPASLRSIHRWIALHKTHRPLLHTGRTVRSDQSDRELVVHGVVAPDQAEALFAVAWLDRSAPHRRVRIEGLDPDAVYTYTALGVRSDPAAVVPSWAVSGPAGPPRLTGAALAAVGLTVPPARWGSALLIHLTAVSGSE